MRAVSSVVSISIHVAVGAVLLFGTAQTGKSNPLRPLERRIFFQPVRDRDADDGGGPSIPGPIRVVPPDLGELPSPTLPQSGATMPSLSPDFSLAVGTGGAGQPAGWGPLLIEQPAEILTGPLPVFPDLLRQAGVQGKVVLEAVVDTTGRVLPQSISVVSATNPGFVAPARQALLATLFRPAMTGGKPVRLRVHIPYEFTIRNGIGRAR
jgi:periplasmic protein TonB